MYCWLHLNQLLHAGEWLGVMWTKSSLMWTKSRVFICACLALPPPTCKGIVRL
jgi:hypothetical protein